jgi:hypothetical protein
LKLARDVERHPTGGIMSKCRYSSHEVSLPDNPDNLPVECPVCSSIRKLNKNGIYPPHEEVDGSRARKRWKLIEKEWKIVE